MVTMARVVHQAGVVTTTNNNISSVNLLFGFDDAGVGFCQRSESSLRRHSFPFQPKFLSFICQQPQGSSDS